MNTNGFMNSPLCKIIKIEYKVNFNLNVLIVTVHQESKENVHDQYSSPKKSEIYFVTTLNKVNATPFNFADI